MRCSTREERTRSVGDSQVVQSHCPFEPYTGGLKPLTERLLVNFPAEGVKINQG